MSLVLTDVPGYDATGPVQWFLIALQLNISGLEGNTEYFVLFWAVWFIQFIVGSIVLMNFIIAVVGNSFTNCMAKREAQTLKVRVDMIFERESIMRDMSWFPQYIVVRKPADAGGSDATHLETVDVMAKETTQIAKRVTKLEDKLREVKDTLDLQIKQSEWQRQES